MNTPRLLSRGGGIRIRFYSTTPRHHPYLSRTNLNGPSSSSSSSSSSPHIGPFPLPYSKLDRDYLISQQSKTWSELKRGEKLNQVAKQTSSLFVVIFGAGLCGLVVWAVASELFSENSPTRIFEDITERLKLDKGLNSILIGPLSFHGSSSTSTDRLSRRNRRISHSLTLDPQTGLETLLIRFIVEGIDPHAKEEANEEDWLDWCKKWIGPIIWKDSKNPENYKPILSTDLQHSRQEEEEEERQRRTRRRNSWTSWLGGIFENAFGGITRGVSSSTNTVGGGGESSSGMFKRLRKPKLGEYHTGEVVAELQKDPKTNQFVYKQLFVALPDTQTPSYYRHDIPTDIVVPPEEGGGQEGGLNRLRIWQRNKTVVQ